MRFDEFKKRISSIILCVGLLAVVIVANRSTFSMSKGHTSLLPTNFVEVQEKHKLFVDSDLNSNNYLVLFNNLAHTLVNEDNVSITYQSVDANTNTINVNYTQVKDKGCYSIFSNNIAFLVFHKGKDLYCKLSDKELINYYHLTNTNYWNKVVNNNNLLNLLDTYNFENLAYGGEIFIDGNEYVKVVADGILPDKAESVSKGYRSNNVKSSTIADVSNLNVLTDKGKFVFYFDKSKKILRRLTVNSDNSYTIIDIEPTYALTMFATVEDETFEEITEDKLGRLMLSSIFAMVSESQLNELSPVQDSTDDIDTE